MFRVIQFSQLTHDLPVPRTMNSGIPARVLSHDFIDLRVKLLAFRS